MSRKLILAVAATVGSLIVVGCGPTDPSKAVGDASKKVGDAAKEGVDKAKEGVDKAKEMGAEALKKPFEEAKGAIDKEVGAIEKKWGEMKAAMEGEKDAAKKAEMSKNLTDSEGKLGAIKKMIAEGFSLDKLKDMASFTKLKDEIMSKIAELKKAVGL